MKIKEYQESIQDALNGIESLVQGGCKAIAEDRLTAVADVAEQIQVAAGVALVVMTPDFTRNGQAEGGAPCEARVVVACTENVALNRARGGLTSLDAAEIVAHAFDGRADMCFNRIWQSADERAGTLTANVEFMASTLI